MQTKINKRMAFGIPGTHGNGQPYVADPYVADSTVVFGSAVKLNSDGTVGKATSSDAIGIAISPQEHVANTLPSSTNTLTPKQGDTVAVIKKGTVYVKVPTKTADTEAGLPAKNWTKGAKLNYAAVDTDNPSGLVYNASGTAAVILEVEDYEVVSTLSGGNPVYSIDGAPVALIRFL